MKRNLGAILMTGLLVIAVQTAAVNAWSSENKTAPERMNPKTEDVLNKTIAFYKGLQGLEVNYSVKFMSEVSDTVNYELAAVRPNKYFSKFVKGESGAHVISDGEDFTIYLPGDKVYIREKAPDDFDGILDRDQPSRNMGNIMFLSKLLRNNAFSDITAEVISAEYLGAEDGSHHLRFKEQYYDLDLWISSGDKPFINKTSASINERNLRIEIAYSDWKINPEIPDTAFSFTLPEDALTMQEYMASRKPPSPADWLGKQAPAINLELLSGGRFNLADYKNKSIVILDFWATWCGPCRQGLPMVSGIAEKYKSKGVVFYSVNQLEPAGMVREFMDDNDWDFKVALDIRGAVSQTLSVTSIPTTMIIDRDGSVQVVHQGISRNTANELRSELDSLIAGKQLAETK